MKPPWEIKLLCLQPSSDISADHLSRTSSGGCMRRVQSEDPATVRNSNEHLRLLPTKIRPKSAWNEADKPTLFGLGYLRRTIAKRHRLPWTSSCLICPRGSREGMAIVLLTGAIGFCTGQIPGYKLGRARLTANLGIHFLSRRYRKISRHDCRPDQLLELS